MIRNRLMMGVALAIIFAFLASAFVFRALKQAASGRIRGPVRSVVVASVPIDLGTRLEASKLKTIEWPAGEPIPGMITRIQDCVGRAVITSLAENEPILESNLAPLEAGAGLAATIPEGMRALSVAVNDVIGVAGFVTPGTMVDVLVTGQVSDRNQGPSSNITRTILENVRVLAAGQKFERDADGKPQNVPVITLLVSPEDAAKLAMASTEGKIQLALRNTIDNKTMDPPAVMQSSLFMSDGAPAPAQVAKHVAPRKAEPAAPPPPFTVEVITGDKRETKSFPNP